jgi:hypothetical protein
MIRTKLHGFVYALFDVTYESLFNIEHGLANRRKPQTKQEVIDRQASLASTFRSHMTEGQSFGGPSLYRKDFYKKVMEKADAAKVSFR